MQNSLSQKDAITLFNQMHPNHFNQPYLSEMEEGEIMEEQIMYYKDFDVTALEIPVPPNVTFGWYEGDASKLMEAVKSVEKSWTEFEDFKNCSRIFCAMVDGEIASFCIAEDMGVHTLNGRKIKIGGPGCVGTVKKFRRKGIGLSMVQKVSQILKEEGFEIGWIHWTGVGHWYAKLGYQTVLWWEKKGFCNCDDK